MMLRAEVVGAIAENSGGNPTMFAEALELKLLEAQAEILRNTIQEFERRAKGAVCESLRTGWADQAAGARKVASLLGIHIP